MGFKGSHGGFGISPHRNYDNLKRLEEEKGENFNVMVPDCYDGYNVLPMLLRNKKVDCYETNDVLLNGGTIDGFYTIGLKQKVNNYNLNRKVNIYKKNFYTTRIEKEYDYVYCYRSLHLDRNKDIRMEVKIRKLLSSVKFGGYVYIFYYMADDEKNFEKYPKDRYLRSREMRKYLDLSKWDIIYNIEGHSRIHGPHPYQKAKHYHKTGVILAKKKNLRKKIIHRYIYTIH